MIAHASLVLHIRKVLLIKPQDKKQVRKLKLSKGNSKKNLTKSSITKKKY